MIYRVTVDRAKEGSVERVCAVRATTRVPETALVPETRRSNCGRLKNGAHNSPHLEKRRRNRIKSIPESFAGAVMNFSHFTSTDQCLRQDSIRGLLHNLMRQQAALQLCHGQIHWDHLIPIYFSTPTAPFDPSALLAVVVQVKNRHCATPLKVDGREYDDCWLCPARRGR